MTPHPRQATINPSPTMQTDSPPFPSQIRAPLSPEVSELMHVWDHTHTFILGGSPCSGKTSLAERLSAACHLLYYKADDHEDEHPRRVDPARHPVMARYANKGWDAIWSEPPDQAALGLLGYYRERWEFVLQDLLALTAGQAVLAEGAPFTPELVAAAGMPAQQTIFLVPTFDFQMTYYPLRPWIPSILAECRDPQQAFANWMARDFKFGELVREQAQALGYRCIVMDGSISPNELFSRVGAHYGLASKESCY